MGYNTCMERFSRSSKPEAMFIFPNVRRERGEIERVAQTYRPLHPTSFVQDFLEKAQQASLVNLSEEMWSLLDNTDSFDIPINGWEQVAAHIDHTNHETGATRDWEDLKIKMEQGKELDAPIILKQVNDMHVVSGNTRLMVARALGKVPKVLLVDMGM